MNQFSSLQPIDLSALLPAYHEITLPSNGLFSQDIPQKLNIRGMTVKELKHLTASGKLDKTIFDSCLSGCIKESIDLSSLILEDYNYIVYMCRLYSSGPNVSAIHVCDNPSCRQQFKFSYNISDCVELELAENTISKTKIVNLPRFKEAGYNVNIEVKRLTRKDVITVEKNIKAATELAAKLDQPLNVFPLIELLKSYIVSISGFSSPVPKEALLDVLSSEDTELITSAFADEIFGVKGEAKPVCPICKTENTYVVPFTDVFFL